MDWNWEDLIAGYNKKHGTKYKNDEEMLKDLYVEQDIGYTKIGSLLGLSPQTVRVRLVNYGISLKGRGGVRNKKGYEWKEIIFGLNPQTMTPMEIAKSLGISYTYAKALINKFGIPSKKMVRGRPWHKQKGGTVK